MKLHRIILWAVCGLLASSVVCVSGYRYDGSCRGRCGELLDENRQCQCNYDCENFGDCCSDYERFCLDDSWPSETSSCRNRCGDSYDDYYPCQCNIQCQRSGDCCADYRKFCSSDKGSGGSKQDVTDEEIRQLATTLINLDVNAPSKKDYKLDMQSRIEEMYERDDPSPNRLFSYVNETLLSKPTYAALIKLFDNYNPYYGEEETVTRSEEKEEEDFIKVIVKTKVVQKAWSFLKSIGYSSSIQSEFESQLKHLWFTLYQRTRASDVKDSSGFEHVFVGEIKSRSHRVSGLHSWVRYYLQEKSGKANYAGYYDYLPHEVKFKFTWLDSLKPAGGFFVGTSPEWDLAISTVCFLLRPNRRCNFQMDNREMHIQSFSVNGQRDVIATAFPKM